MKPDQTNTPEPTDRAEESELATPPCSRSDTVREYCCGTHLEDHEGNRWRIEDVLRYSLIVEFGTGEADYSYIPKPVADSLVWIDQHDTRHPSAFSVR
jgi:hypothetical protein